MLAADAAIPVDAALAAGLDVGRLGAQTQRNRDLSHLAAQELVLDGGVLIIETSEELLPARNVGWIVRSLGERGILAAVDAVLVARPPVSDHTRRPPSQERARLRAEQRDVVVEIVGRYNPDAVVCVGIPFGHTRPQWIVPHGGAITVDGTARRVIANYS